MKLYFEAKGLIKLIESTSEGCHRCQAVEEEKKSKVESAADSLSLLLDDCSPPHYWE